MTKSSMEEFLEREDVNITVRTYLIDALEAMAFGLFASLLIGTVFGTLGQQLQTEISNVATDYAKGATDAALDIAIAHALRAPQLMLFSTTMVGIADNALGGPVGTLVATIMAAELDKIVSKETCLDITVTPSITIISGMLMAQFMGPGATQFMSWFGNPIKTTTEMQPFIMGILVSVLIGIALTLPISSTAICTAPSLDGLAGGVATADCCIQIIGFAVINYRENRVSGPVAQGLGTSVLQMGNIVLNPRVWIPPTLASMIAGPITTMAFRLENILTEADMGACGLVGPIGVYTATDGGTRMWAGIPLVYFLLPGVLTFAFGEVLRRMEWIRDGDLELDL